MIAFSRKMLSVVFVTVTVVSANAQENAGAKKPDPRPNIVFILVDELGVNELGCYGRKEHKTPNIDKLAERGIKFTNAYASTPESGPTETALFTGKNNPSISKPSARFCSDDVAGHLLLHPKRIEAESPDLRSKLKTSGYHVTASRSGPSTITVERGNSEFLKTIRPFFALLRWDYEIRPLTGAEALKSGDKYFLANPSVKYLERIDNFVGMLVESLEEAGIANDTLVVLTSTSGGRHLAALEFVPSNSPFRAGKGFLYEGGVRVPLIACWPGKIKPGITDETPVISTDWTPTLYSIAGSTPPEGIAGVNLSSLLFERKAMPQRPLFWHYPFYTWNGGKPAGAVREGQWKLLEDYETGACELFNIDRDPRESTDLAANEPAKVADLRGKLEKWRRETGTAALRPNPRFNAIYHRELFDDVNASGISGPVDPMSVQRLQAWRSKMLEVEVIEDDFGRIVEKRPETANSTGAGAILLSGADAKVHGDKLRYEPQPQKDTLGFWVNKNDWLEWTFTAPHKGTFDVEMLQACGNGSGGAEVEVQVAGQSLTMKVEETGHFQRFVPRVIGQVKLDNLAPITLTVRAKTKPGPAVMDLRRIVLKESLGNTP